MAGVGAHLEDDLSCPVCFQIFQDPVVLSCSHSICKECLQQFWKNSEAKKCPVCRTWSKTEPLRNLVLKNLCESYDKERQSGSSAMSKQLCCLHNEQLRLFCLQDKQLVCVVYQSSRNHRNHLCCPVDEAAADFKKELRTALEPLQEKLKFFKEFEQTCNETIQHIKRQAQKTEVLIKKEFEKLHKFLHDEEESRIAALKKEEEQKSVKMNDKHKEISRQKPQKSLSETIRAIELDLGADDVLFVSPLMLDLHPQLRSKWSHHDPKMDSGSLLDVALHLGILNFKVWEKMKDIVKYYPVILDPNTASQQLAISDNLASALDIYSYTDTVRDYDGNVINPPPKNPERFNVTCVLGSEGLNSGTHCWDIEVGKDSYWYLGITTESNKAKGWDFVSNDKIICVSNDYCYHTLPQFNELHVDVKLQRIRLRLDFSRGELSFYNSLTNTHLTTIKHRFTEKIFPFFIYVGEKTMLKILPLTPSIKLK